MNTYAPDAKVWYNTHMSCFSITAELLCGLLACIATAAPAAEGAPSSTNIEELVSTGSPLFRSHARFRLTGVLLDNRRSPSFFCDGRAIVLFYASGNERTDVRAGDVVVVEGTSHNGEYEVQALSVLGKTDIPKPTAVSPVDVQKGRCANMFVVTQGRVTDVFKDDIDASFLYLLISADGATACASIVVQRNVEALAQKLLGAEVRVCGVCMPPITFQRPYAGCIIRLLDASSLETVNPAVTDPLSFPELETPSYAAPQEICAMGKRHIRGTVMAVSDDDSFLMRDGSGRLHRVQFAGGQHPPRFNDTVVVGGTVQTDFYLVNLSHAIFKVTGHSDTPPEEPVHVTAAEILYTSTSFPLITVTVSVIVSVSSTADTSSVSISTSILMSS